MQCALYVTTWQVGPAVGFALSLSLVSSSYAFLRKIKIGRWRLFGLMVVCYSLCTASASFLRIAEWFAEPAQLEQPLNTFSASFYGFLAGVTLCVWLLVLRFTLVLLDSKIMEEEI